MGEIKVSFTPECIHFMRDLGVPHNRALITINESHQALVSFDRVISAHWFNDDDIVLVESIIKDRTINREQDTYRITEVEAQLVLPLRSNLPAGAFTRKTPMDKVLAVVAESFGQEVIGSTPPTKLYTGPWNEEKNGIRVNGQDSTFVFMGTFCPDENRCELLWVFNTERYRQWFTARANTEPVKNSAISFRVALEPVMAIAKAHMKTFSQRETEAAMKDSDGTKALKVKVAELVQ